MSALPCPRCGLHHASGACTELVQTSEAEVSVADETITEMVESASVPNLAALIRDGKEKGLIKPVQGYTHTT